MGIAVSVKNGLQRQAGYWTIIPPTAGHRQRGKEMRKERREVIP